MDRQINHIRRMQPGDIPAVAALEKEVFSMPWSEKGFEDALAQPGNIFLVSEMSTGQIIAYCGLYVAAAEGEITNVATAEHMRGQGVGFALVSEICREAFENGISNIFLEVRKSNNIAHRLYEKSGFVDCGIRKNFYEKPQEDAIVMCRELRRINDETE